MTRVLLVTATDARFYPMLRDMLTTLQPNRWCERLAIACFDIGMRPEQRAALEAEGIIVTMPRVQLGVAPWVHDVGKLSFLSRPVLPDIFPGHDVYVWVDGDIWFQSGAVLQRYVAGALAHGFAITHERSRAYRLQPWLFGWTAKHFLLGYGVLRGARLALRRHVNAGFFAGRADAPHWRAWADRYRAAIRRTGALVPHDQFALVQALHDDGLDTTWLEPDCNWIVDRGIPMWNDAAGAFCAPYEPYQPIAALHLAGPGKRSSYTVKRTGGGTFRTRILPGRSPAFAEQAAMDGALPPLPAAP